MRKGRVREILEAMIWNPEEDPKDYTIVFISRGAEGDLEQVSGSEIHVRSDRIVLKDGRVIPHHRIVAITKRSELGTILLWRDKRWYEDSR